MTYPTPAEIARIRALVAEAAGRSVDEVAEVVDLALWIAARVGAEREA